MNREILFKGKRTDNGEWAEGNLLVSDERYFIVPELGVACTEEVQYRITDSLITLYALEVEPETVCQYTGLTDKNGKKIWENDIVKCNYNDYGEKGTYIGKVIFREDTCSFVVTNGKSTDYEWWNEEKEIIGNIFDNPELINQ